MENIAEGAGKLLLRFIRNVLIEGISEFVVYWLGRCFLLLVTLGRYPRGEKTKSDETKIIITGIAVLVAIIVGISLIL